MNQKLLHISELHISEDASQSDARRIIDLLGVEGWIVTYGDHPWQFGNEAERPLFEKAFQWAVKVREAEKRPFHQETFINLARERIRLNEKLQPYESKLLDKRPEWSGYLGWLIETPANVILQWLEMVWKKKDVSTD